MESSPLEIIDSNLGSLLLAQEENRLEICAKATKTLERKRHRKIDEGAV